MKDVTIPLNDIAPLVEIDDYSFYYFLGVVILAAAITAAVFLLVAKTLRSRKASTRKANYIRFGAVNLHNPKQAAYEISELGRYFAGDNERTQKAYQNLFERLEPYKYAPVVDPIDEETLGYYRMYLEIIDV